MFDTDHPIPTLMHSYARCIEAIFASTWQNAVPFSLTPYTGALTDSGCFSGSK